MSLVIKKHSHTKASTARIFRGMAKLSDGKFAVLTFNSNISGKSGSSSENNNTPKLYVVIFNADWSTFLTTSIQIGTANAKQNLGQIAALAVDASNNIHVAYTYSTAPQNASKLTQGQTLRYRKLTYNGATLVAGPETTLFSTVGFYSGVDIDVPRGAAVATAATVAFVHTTNGTSFVTRIVQLTGLQTTAIETITSAARGVSFALNNTVDATAYKWLATTFQIEAGTDVGDTIIHGTGTTSTAPALVTTLAQNLNVGLGGGIRNLAVFRDANTFIITGPVAVNEYSQFIASYSIPVDSGATVTYSPTNIVVGGKFAAAGGYQLSAMQIDTTNSAIVCHLSDGKNVYAQVFDYVLGASLTWAKFATKWKMDQQYLGKNIAPSLIYNGDRSINGTAGMQAVVDFAEAYQYVLYRRVPVSGKIVATMTSPANNGTVNKGNPSIVVQVSGSTNNNVVGRVQFQTAKDANFTVEVSDFYSGYMTFLKSLNVTINLPEGAVSQGLVYTRARVVDQLGFTYSWNDTQKFTSVHKPTVSFASPVRGAVAVYNADNTVTFKLTFSDPDSTDSMTAYRIQLTDLSGAVIVDTGKVTSTNTTINVAVGAGNVNADLLGNAWVWDEDDVMSDVGTTDFKLAVLPTVVFDDPISGVAISTATPTYSWVPTLPVGRTQVNYRITVRKGLVIIWDSGIMSGSGDTLVQPAGYIKNSSSYEVTVWIKDNLGMTAMGTITMPTSWNKPVSCPAPWVDLSLYADQGFAYVTLVPPSIDPLTYPNTKISLMRRSIFSNTKWEEVTALQMGAGLNYSVIDSSLPAGVDTLYAAVLQIDTGGDLAVGDPSDSVATLVKPPVSDYWLIDADDYKQNTKIKVVTSDDFTEEQESETVTIANRGRWVEVGDTLGPNGNLVAKIYNRDFNLGDSACYNYLKNPRILATGTGISGIANWVLQAASYITRRTYSPAPSGNGDSVAFAKTGGSDAVLYQDVPRTPGVYTAFLDLETSYIVAAAGKSVTIKAECFDGVGASLGSFSQVATLVQSGSAMIPNSGISFASPLGSQFAWYRIYKTFTAPSGTKSIRVSAIYTGSSGDYLTVGSAMLLDSASTYIRYFDGDTEGAEWLDVSDPTNSISFTAGKITARSSRRRLTALSNSKHRILLRNPFGDVFEVKTGQIQISRMAGTGTDEFVQATIPYYKIGL